MSLVMHWAEQTLSEVTCTVEENDEQVVAAAVMSLIEFLYSLEYEIIIDENRVEQYALEVLPQKWHLIVKEADRIRRGLKSSSLFASREQRSKTAGDFAAYVIHYYNERYGLFKL